MLCVHRYEFMTRFYYNQAISLFLPVTCYCPVLLCCRRHRAHLCASDRREVLQRPRSKCCSSGHNTQSGGQRKTYVWDATGNPVCYREGHKYQIVNPDGPVIRNPLWGHEDIYIGRVCWGYSWRTRDYNIIIIYVN